MQDIHSNEKVAGNVDLRHTSLWEEGGSTASFLAQYSHSQIGQRDGVPLQDVAPDSRGEDFFAPALPKLPVLPATPLTEPGEQEQNKDLSSLMPDVWPELENIEDGEGGQHGDDAGEPDATQIKSGLMMARAATAKKQRPAVLPGRRNGLAGSQPAQLSERAQQSQCTGPAQLIRHRRDVSRRLRLVFISLLSLALIALLVDGVLLSMSLTRHEDTQLLGTLPVASPLLTVTPGTVHLGQVVLLRLSHFTASTHVFLSHDIQEAVRTDVGSSLIEVGPNGEADVHILVEESWGAGLHVIEGEDVTTHYTASATVQIIGAIRPPQLVVSQHVLNMGTDWQGANTIQPLVLKNRGGGSVSWVASSDQPWLMFTPTQGIFAESQGISLAVTRANLKAGNYQGTMTIVSNAGPPVHIAVQLGVRALPVHPGPVLVAIPPALAFTATDGAANPADQLLRIDNAGSQALSWTLANTTALVPGNSDVPFLSDVSWIGADPTLGAVAPGSAAQLRLMVQSQRLLPGVYSVLLTFAANQPSFNSPQPVVVSLTVQPRCGVATSLGMLAFSAIAGQSGPGSQSLGLGTTAGCASETDSINWQAFTSAAWLTVKPAESRLQIAGSATTTVDVRVGTLQAGTYAGFIVFVTGQRTQTVAVQLTVLSAAIPFSSPTAGGGLPTATASPGPGTPTLTATSGIGTPTPTSGIGTPTPTPLPEAAILSIAQSNRDFTATQGQGNPADQFEMVSNPGGSQLKWQANMDASASLWLSLAPMNGTLDADKSSQMRVSVNASGLVPGTYSTQVSVVAHDSSGRQVQGSPQLFTVTLTVWQPCSLQVSPLSLTFTATLLQPNPPGQQVTLKESGHCASPVRWTASVDAGSRSWLSLSSTSGTDNSTITVYASGKGKLLGQYVGNITFTATASGGATVQNSPQTVSVTLTVLG